MTRRITSRAAGALRLLPGGRGRSGGVGETTLVRRAQQLLDLRRRRSEHFGSAMFGEPAWDILLAAYVGEQQGDHPTIANVADAAGVSVSVALRWLDFLVGEGLAERAVYPTPSDKNIVRLTDRCRETLKGYLAETFS